MAVHEQIWCKEMLKDILHWHAFVSLVTPWFKICLEHMFLVDVLLPHKGHNEKKFPLEMFRNM